MTAKPRVLVVGPLRQNLDAKIIESYGKLFELVYYEFETRERMIELFQTDFSDIEGIIALWVGFLPIGGMFKELVDALPESLKVIAIPSVGYDHYDEVALQKKGVILCNSPGLSAEGVADIALHLILSSYRMTSAFERALRTHGNTIVSRAAARQFDQVSGQVPTELTPTNEFNFGYMLGNFKVESSQGQRAGIAGFGAIGQATARRLHAMGMKIHYTKRKPLTEAEEKALGFPLVYHDSIESLFKESDALVLALPLTKETKHMVNADTIKLMPDGARVVNVGRGPLIDQKALIDGLKSGKLSGAGLDVFEFEPVVEPELLSRYDVTLLPHLGGCTKEIVEGTLTNCFINVEEVVIKKTSGLHPVNID